MSPPRAARRPPGRRETENFLWVWEERGRGSWRAEGRTSSWGGGRLRVTAPARGWAARGPQVARGRLPAGLGARFSGGAESWGAPQGRPSAETTVAYGRCSLVPAAQRPAPAAHAGSADLVGALQSRARPGLESRGAGGSEYQLGLPITRGAPLLPAPPWTLDPGALPLLRLL